MSFEQVWLQPNLYFRFATADKNTEVRVEYAKQFPVLERLIIGKEKIRNKKFKEYSDHFHFETIFPFLLDSFLSKTNPPCETLKHLDIPFPTDDKFRYNDKKQSGECGHDGETCKCWGLMESSTFYVLVTTIFPKLEIRSGERCKTRGLNECK